MTSTFMTRQDVTRAHLEQALAVLRSDGLSLPENMVVEIDVPADPTHGDLSSNVAMQLAKPLGLAPREIAERLVEALSSVQEVRDGYYADISVAGPGFLNFTFSSSALGYIGSLVQSEQQAFGRSSVHEGATAMLEFFQPNIAKPLHVGHLRSAMVGHACLGLLQSQGYNVVTDTHYGDWGVQFGILLNAFLRLSKDEQEAVFSQDDPVAALNAIYVEENARIENETEVRDEGKATFARLEEGDEMLRSYWQRFVDVSLTTYPPVLNWLGVPPFTVELGESFYEDRMPADLERAAAIRGAVREDKALYIDLEDVGLGRCYLRKSDGSTTYHARDLSTCLHRLETWELSRNLYFVGEEQSHHFRQLFEVVRRLGESEAALAEASEHVVLGLMKLPEGKFSTRKGNIVRATQLFEEAERRVLDVIQEKNPDLVQKERAAQQIAVGVLKWWDLSHDHTTSFVFTWDRALSFEGNTGPYMQYTVARLHRLLDEAPDDDVRASRESAVWSGLGDERFSSERALLRQVVRYEDVLRVAAEQLEPHVLCAYLFALAQQANAYYADVPVLKEEDEALRRVRLATVLVVRQVLANGLQVLGIPVVEEM